jgi:hypothetical protein
MPTHWCVRLISLLALVAATAPAQVVVLTPTSTVFNPAGGTMVFNASVSYSTPPSVLAFSATIPSGWSHVSTGTGPSVVPAAGATGTLDWIYVSAPPSPFTFNFTVQYPANVSGAQPLTSTTITRDATGSPSVSNPGPGVTLTVPSNTAVWDGTTGNWTDAARWSGSTVPANGAATTYAARVTAGTVTSNAPVTVNDLQFIGGTINNLSTLTLAGSGSIWEAGIFTGVGQLVINSNAFLTAATANNHDFAQTAITNQGQFIWNGSGSLRSGNGGSFLNASGATFTDATSGAVQITNSTIGGNFTFTNAGTYLKTGSTQTTVSVPFVNQGSIIANAGTLQFANTFTQSQSTGNILLAPGATARFDQGLNLAAGNLTGSGTVVGNVTNAAFISPGSILGQLTIQGNLSLAAGSVLQFDIGGTTQGTTYDFLNVTGTAQLAGTLTINLVNGAQSTILPTNSFTLLNASSITGSFSNVTNGARIFATNGVSSFVVSYTPTSLVLSSFNPIPEPSTWALLATGLAAVAVSIRHRRRGTCSKR